MRGSAPARVVSDGLCSPTAGPSRGSPQLPQSCAPALRYHCEAWLWQACFSSMASPPKIPRWGPARLMAFPGTANGLPGDRASNQPSRAISTPSAGMGGILPPSHGLTRWEGEQKDGFQGRVHPGGARLCPGALGNGHVPPRSQ